MKNTKFLSEMAVAFIAGFFLLTGSGVANAQSEDDGFPFPPQQEAAAPAPQNPALKSLDSGRLIIAVGSPRNFGYRIGDPIPLTMVVSADKNVQVNLEAIRRKTLSTEGSDFELVEAPVVTQEQQGDKTIWRVQLLLRSWVIKPVLVFNCDFHFASELLPDGKTPNWRPVSSPEFVVEMSNIATEAAKDLLPGDMDLKESPKPALVKPLKYAGLLAFSLLPAWLLWQLWCRVRPRRPITTAERAWMEFDQVMAEAESAGGLKYEHLFRISGTLRSYLQIEAVPTCDVAIPLEQFFAMHDDRLELMTVTVSALSKLERALYSKIELTTEEQFTLMREIERIVPRKQQ